MRCHSCKFYVYNYQYKDYICIIKGCINYNKYKEFTIKDFQKDTNKQK